MPGTITNLLKSGARVLRAPVGTAFPDETTVAYGAAFTGFTELGFSDTPVVLGMEEEEFEWMLDDPTYLGAVDVSITGESAFIETNLAEPTATNIALAKGLNTTAVSSTPAGASQKAYSEVDLGGNAMRQKWAIALEGQRVNASGVSLPVRVFFWRATFIANGNLEFSTRSDNLAAIPIRIRALASTDSATAGKLMRYQEVTGPATS